jgi:CBS domain-containing protein
MFVKDIMTHRVDFINRTDTIQEAAQKMRDDNVGALPVFDSNYLVGMLTDRDITIRSTASGKDPLKTRVYEIMTSEVYFCSEKFSIEEAAALMEKKQVRRLLVKNADGHVTGMISLTDLARGFNRELAAQVLSKISTPAKPQWL